MSESVGVITLRRPERLNALNYSMADELLEVIAQCKDTAIRVVVITGVGRAFCSGDDLKEMGDPELPGHGWLRWRHHAITKNLRNLPKPVIAAINGNCHGAGSDLALSCDFRIAAEEAQLGDLRLKRGYTIGSGATYLVPRVVGLNKALELLLTGKAITGKEAAELGFVNRAVPGKDLMMTVMSFARELARGPTKVMGVTKQEIYRHLDMSLEEALEDEVTVLETEHFDDVIEGRRAFKEKRSARFTGS